MFKKFISFVLVVSFLISLFPLSVPVSANSSRTITLSLNGSYAGDTLPGTKLKVTSVANLEAGEKVVYKLNGEKVSESDGAGEFMFESVSGKNILTAEIATSSDEVICTSNSIELDFLEFAIIPGKAKYEYDFENGEYKTSMFSRVGKYSGVVTSDDQKNSKVLRLSATELGDSPRFPASTLNSVYTSGYVLMEYDLLIEKFPSGQVRPLHALWVNTASSGNRKDDIYLLDGGNLKKGTTTLAKFEEAKWHNIKYFVNFSTGEVDIYLDGVKVREAIYADFKCLENFDMPRFMSLATGADTAYRLDNIKLVNYGELYTVSSYKEKNAVSSGEGLDGFPLSGGTAVLKFSQKMTEVKKEDITFTVDGEERDFNFAFDSSTNEARISPSLPLNGREKCRISFDGAKTSLGLGASCNTFIDFTADAPVYGISSVEHDEIIAGSDTLITVTVNNDTEENKRGIVLVGIYDDTGLLSVDAKDFSVNSASDKEVYLTIKAPDNYNSFKHKLKTFLMTDDTYFSLDVIQPAEDEEGFPTETLYALPKLIPPENTHPRLLATAEIIPELKKNKTHPVLMPVYNKVYERGTKSIDCHMPDKGKNNNISLERLFDIQCRAYLYLLGEVDKNHARQTVQHMLDMYDTLVWNTSTPDITRSIGSTLAASGLVYDWCYDVLTHSQKALLINHMKNTASLMEIGYPTTTKEIFAGHGGEGEVFYYQLAAGIATYDEDPEMYNLAAGMMFEYMFDSRKYFNATGNHPAGSSYGPVRIAWEELCQVIFDRMGHPDIMGNDIDKAPMRWIHDRLPSGFWSEDGDSTLQFDKSSGPYYNPNDYPMMLYGAYFGNPYLRGEYMKELSLRWYLPGESLYDNGIHTLLLLNPDEGYAYPDDEGNELPLTYTTSYPLTSMFMRTSWATGKESDTAVVFMNGQEKLVGDHDHEHSDIGNFQIYYKGTLAGHGGTYQGKNGGWGSEHYWNYYRRTISKNCMTVFDPDEPIIRKEKVTSYANDGGQLFEEDSASLEEFLSHKDQAATEGVYVGPNSETPDFSYLKTNLTDAYSDKVAGYTRSMVALNLFNNDYPLAFICYDNITSSNSIFKKTWNLQTVQEPEITGAKTVVKRDDYDFSGKLVVNTMLPENAVIEKVGGDGFESYVNGKNYPNEDIGTNDNEQCDWRLEISPENPSEDDVFLNAMYVTDSNKNLPELLMYKEENENFVGVTVMDRTVLFSKDREVQKNNFELSVKSNGYDTMCVLITDVEEGKWNVSGNDVAIVCEVKSGENALYVRLSPGTYTFSKGADNTPVTAFNYPRNENIDRVGDVLVYDRTAKNFVYTKEPTILSDGNPYISQTDFAAKGISIEKDGDDYVLIYQNYEAVITPGSVSAMLNDVPIVLTSAPFVNNEGLLYINPLDMSGILGHSISYDKNVRMLIINQ